MLCPGGEAVRFCCLAAPNYYEMLARGAAREERGTREEKSHSLGMRIKVLYFDTGFLF